MFQSEPICIFTAGKTVDGREFGQEVVDDIAETYNPETYNARINEDHWSWGEKFGSVLAVEKRGNQLWAVLKPNALFFDTIQKGQLLHTSCELQPDFAGSGKWYLTGLALTDSPASLGTTAIHLSAEDESKGKVKLSTGETIGGSDTASHKEQGEHAEQQAEQRLFSRLKQFFSANTPQPEQHLNQQDENEEMDQEAKQLLEQQTEALATLTAAVTLLTAAPVTAPVAPVAVVPDVVNTPPVNTLETLSAKFDELTEKLSKLTDENPRLLAGAEGEVDYL